MNYRIQYNNVKRSVTWEELNQLKKDILWIYDENYNQINAAFVPSYSFKLKYHEYLFLSRDRHFTDYDFYIDGTLIILLAVCVEYLDVAGGDPKTLSDLGLQNVSDSIRQFTPVSDIQGRLKNRILLGLDIASTLTDSDLLDSDLNLYNKHNGVPLFYDDINELADTVIKAYYVNK
ncbi:MAG: hypothetical protein H3C54_00055 [Taibaiella sp.]|nr:hypothetical protein [Taibaiella sp.]